MKQFTLTLLLLIGLTEFTYAQNFYARRRDRNWALSAGIGQSIYVGELYTPLFDKSAGFTPNVGVGLRRKITDQLSVRFDINYYQIAAADSLAAQASFTLGGGDQENDSRNERNLSFRSHNFEFSSQFIFNLIPIDGPYSYRPDANIYAIAGIGVTTNNPRGLDIASGNMVNLRKLNTEALEEPYSGLALVIPLGMGIRIKANQFTDIVLEGTGRVTFNDYLDDASTLYPSEQEVRDYHVANGTGLADLAARMYDRAPEKGFGEREKGSIRGNPEYNDYYFFFQVRLEMYLSDTAFGGIFASKKTARRLR
ncbi:hypothetical protein [Roseivirga pacifica]|uniref:hypothetical protein n=1 Tax=Roseivirga pacifica TaxID=1267423 RepID=UPI0020964CF6|nr:hypothetical protein [Roseivirga pacifica]MCO6357431.1 hypothetical protein [Roseivirga pacifica]MCO6367805.1 hypothetical protein [Roseivirga pacifica]MCO6369664.1 hypothetical protein [Roseivirga pacifica]MCO6373518.1 hypothetical protein [Roseivirga pacifica]MCO6377177.1 hypothetical protein [Roseivirga pacifica]